LLDSLLQEINLLLIMADSRSLALLCGSIGGLLLLALCDLVLLATVLAGVIAWLGWRKGFKTSSQNTNNKYLTKADQPTNSDGLSQNTRLSLMSEVLAGTILSPVSIKEPISGLALLKQELTHKKVLDGVSSFEKEALNAVEIDEKIILPSKETIKLEKLIEDHLKGIGEFDQANLTPVKTSEPISGPELAKQESWRSRITQELETFDRSGLKMTSSLEEKNILPSHSTITSERLHLSLMSGLTTGVELKKTETKEPASPMDLARMEMIKGKIEEDIQAFDRELLIPVVTEGKHYVLTAEDFSDDIRE